MKIDVITNDGSPVGVSEASIYGEDGRMGVGGAELFLLTMCRAWHDAGHDVTLYNSPDKPDGSVFKHLSIDAFQPTNRRDVVIVFRSPNDRLIHDTTGLKVWLSCDQATKGSFKKFASKVDKIVTISHHHAQHFKAFYNITNTITIDIPVRSWEYEDEIEKVPYRCLFNHIPGRGVMPLHAAWPLIIREVPEAHLVITSDERLWARWVTADVIQRYKIRFARHENVSYMGAINRRELLTHQLQAQLNLYPCVYEELFCISVAENQVAGCYPITNDIGALKTTNMGTIIEGSVMSPKWISSFVDATVGMLTNQEQLKKEAERVQAQAKERFSLDKILKIWDKKVFNG